MHNYQEYISLSPGIRFGKPCIVGTRIAVQDILGWLASGMTNDEIIEDFPELTLDHIRAALAFAADSQRQTDEMIAKVRESQQRQSSVANELTIQSLEHRRDKLKRS